MTRINKGAIDTLGSVTNDAEEQISFTAPFSVRARLAGTAPLLFHRWSDDAVEQKRIAPKGSKAKKTDDLDSYVYRCSDGSIGLPGEYVRRSIIEAARYRQDPRSPRKSAMDLVKAGLVSLTELASLGSQEWDYLDRRRVQVQRNAITRIRPAFHVGWEITVELGIVGLTHLDAGGSLRLP